MIRFVSLLCLLCLALAKPHVPDADAHPKPKCYWKRLECCWKYDPCGYETKIIRRASLCPTKRCEKKHYDECKPYVRPVNEEHCYKRYVYTTHCVHHAWAPKVCVRKPKLVRKCKVYKVHRFVNKCVRKANVVCSIVKKPCTVSFKYEYPRYCPTEVCYKPEYEGEYAKPPPFVAPHGRLVNESHTPVYAAGKKM